MTNWKPFVSVITPSYNASEYIEDTIQSVLHQSHPHWEMIIADDCSTDGTRDILRQYEQKDERIRVVYLDKNGEPRLPEIQPLNMPRAVMSHFWTAMTDGKRKSFKNSLRLWQSGPALFHLRATASWSRTERRRTKPFKPLKACHMMKL